MKDEFAAFPTYLPPNAWPYWPPNLITGASAPDANPWSSASAPTAAIANSGLLGRLGASSGGLLGSLARSLPDTATAPSTAIGGLVAQRLPTTPSLFLPAQPSIAWDPSAAGAAYGSEAPYVAAPANTSDHARPWDSVGLAAANASTQPLRRPSPPFYGPGDVLMSPPEPAAPEPPKDFRAWLRDALSDENTRYYAGPHLFEALRKLQALTQLLPGSGMVQAMQDSSRASEDAQAGNYGKAAAHLGIGTLNAALDWLPSSKLAIIGGGLATTFPWKRLRTAMGMEAAGKSADEIWGATRLARTADDRWIFEISDKGYRVRPNVGEPTIWDSVTHAPLYEHHVHPGMREAYPDFANVQSFLGVRPLERRYGESNPSNLVVRAPDYGSARSVGIHELQHLIDRFEKHPPGGSPRYFKKRGFSASEAYDHYWRLVGEVAARNAEYRLRMSDRLRRRLPPQVTEDVPRNRQINLYDDEWH